MKRKPKQLLPIFMLAGTLMLVIYGCVTDVLVTTGSIAGAITDAKSGANISGVNVTLSPSGRSFTTSADGRYEFRDIEQGSYTVQATKAGYTQTQKNVEVIAGETSSLDLTLRASAPVMELSTTTLDFGNTATTLTLDIRNTGAAELTWQISEDIAWLSCLPASGTTDADKTSSVVVSVNRNNLTRGNYSQTLAIASNGGSQTVKVTMGVQGINVEASPETLDFGVTTTSLALTLKNTDENPSLVSYTLMSSNDWILLSKSSGQFTYSDNVTVSVDRSQLSAGDYSGILTLTVDGQTKDIPVKMTIAAKSAPTVSMTAVEEITFNSATLRGAIVSVGSSHVIHHGFVWSTTEQPTVETAEKCDLGNSQTAKDFTYNVQDLQPTTTYYVRAYAENNEGIAYSEQQRFTTREYITLPSVETGAATNIQQQQAEVLGTLVATGASAGVTAYGHVWSTRQSPTINDNKTDFGSTTQTGEFTSKLTNLDYNTTYYVRAYATNESGTAYGKEVSFTTQPNEVRLSTIDVTDITCYEATTGGNISDMGGNKVTERGVCYATSPSPTRSDKYIVSESSSNYFTIRITGLSPTTTYYVRAYVVTETGHSYYGNEVVFTTREYITPPTVETGSAFNIQQQSAEVSGSLVATGTPSGVTAYGHVWSTRQNPTVNDNKTNLGSTIQTGDFTSTLTGLDYNTTYHVRAYATNDGGTTYGKEISFTTQPDMVENGLYAYFKFDDNYTDSSETGLSATGVGASFQTSFDGTSALCIPASSSAKLMIPEGLIDQRKMAISFWVKDLQEGHVFHTVRSYDNRPAFMLAVVDGFLKFVVRRYDIGYQWGNCPSFIHGSLNGWHMITLVSDFNITKYATITTRLYVDGVYTDIVTEYDNPFDENDADAKHYDGCTKFIFGGDVSESYSPKLGASKLVIDNLRVYKFRMISDNEVKQVYEYEKATN